ncbi:phage tail sheath subtilisin-like domain-containing protein [Streptomyces sp. NBC_01450]|uniref:phage tail sheath subtilisin-like domain-containing protein n=1 Tax=Streptomyces sp. NBC_01450 TaxID=2903871 RepID=UPI002E2F2CFF|nr:phage tail sheath subtilisin-like domain-containing protein [Streptomyces sp. NBC_01450]
MPASALEPPPPTYPSPPSPPSPPGVTATAVAAAEPVQPLRTDVACFAGRTRRGPLASPVRVTDWAAYTAVFGGLDTALDLPYAVRGFFSNGGTALWVLRTEPAGPTPAAAVWPAGAPSPFAPAAGCRIEAASPGGWADGTRVTVRHRPAGTAGQAQVLVRVDAPGESPESFGWLPAAALPAAVSALSRLVRVVPDGQAPVPPAGTAHAGTHAVTLTGGTPLPGGPDDDGTLADAYADAVRAMTQLPEPALLALPDLDRCGVGERHREELADLLVEGCAQALDRLALLDPPHSPNSPDTAADPVAATRRATEWMEALRQRHDTAGLQACAVHWPPLRVPDPLATVPPALRTVPASGHVAGTTARLDRERGAFATPANASLEDVVDLAHVLRAEQEAAVYASGANLLRCPPGRGPLVWGGRTAVAPARAGGVGDGWFIAHRRLLHRLVRAARAVTEPLLFEPDTPGLRLLLVQGLTEVLLALFEAGALAGERPAEAFRVRCDDGLNPPELVALGQLVCQVEVAPAAPMEFIAVRLLMGGRDRLEVVEA